MIRRLLTMIGLVSVIGLDGCTERPYQSVDLSELSNYKNKQVAVKGLPSIVSDSKFLLSDRNNDIYIEKVLCYDLSTGSYDSAKEALEKEVGDLDEEKIKVFGRFIGDKTIKAKYVEIEGTLYPIYR